MRLSLQIILSMLVLFPGKGFSQNASDTTKNKTISLDEVIISVNKEEETKRDVAQQVQIINANQIENLQSQSTADLISQSGSVFVQKSQSGGGSPVIRGFEASRILLVIDGVRMNNIIYRSGHLQNIITLDNSILDRAEVLFGPSSTIYGSDALGGVIHFYTKKPLFAPIGEKGNYKVNAFSRYGSANEELTEHVDVNAGSHTIASLTSFTFSRFHDLRGGENQNPFYPTSYGEKPYYVKRINGVDSLVKNSDRFLQVQSGFSQYDFLEKISVRQGSHIVHGLNFQYSTSSDVPRYDRLTDPSGNGLKYAEWYYGPQKRLLAAYDFNDLNPALGLESIHASINFQNVEESRHTRRFGNSNLQHRIEKVNVLGADVDLKKTIRQHDLRFGIDGQYNTLKSTANSEDINTGMRSPLDTRYPDGDNSMTNAAIYFSHTWKITNVLTLTDGFRIGISSLKSTISDTSFFHLPYTKAKQNNAVYSGSIGLIHSPSDDLKLSILLSTGFRAPNVDDLSKIFESAPGAVIVPNKDLKPEKTINTEIGLAKIFNGRTSWENSVYYTSFVDAIVTDQFTFNGMDSVSYDGSMSRVYANQNKGKAYIFGFSSNVRSKWSENFEFSFGATYTYGRVKTDSVDYPLDHIPPFMMRMQLSYNYKNFGSDFFVNYNGWKNIKDYYLNGEDNEQYATAKGMPAWLTLNMRMSCKVHKLITLQAGVDNILDMQYRTFASGINAAGRNYIACVRFHY